ncbi:MAG: cytochrome c biogenesis protein CcdA [Thermoleophilia bacterium]|nr:cytochrome c biogenesis protein CcdA [Thermoleophilia bacterium]
MIAALLAGLLSFLSPCVLPLVPSYVAFLTGVGGAVVDGDSTERAVRRRTMLTGLLFVLGFSAVFIALGASASAFGGSLRANDDLITKVGGVLLIVFGLVLLGALNIAALNRDTRLLQRIAGRERLGYVGAFFVGAAFGAGWTPCIGPVLGGILTLAASDGHVANGMLLLTAYSTGLAVPFLIATIAIERFVVLSTWFRRYLVWVNRVSGALLVALGLLMVTGAMTRLSAYASRFTPGWLQ